MNEATKETLQILRDHVDFCLRYPEVFEDGNPEYIKIIAEKLKEVNQAEAQEQIIKEKMESEK